MVLNLRIPKEKGGVKTERKEIKVAKNKIRKEKR